MFSLKFHNTVVNFNVKHTGIFNSDRQLIFNHNLIEK